LQMYFVYIFITLCILCVIGDRTVCEHECFPYRSKCHTDCRKDFMSNPFRKKFWECSRKCEAEFRDCDDTCECRALNLRELAGCRHSCLKYVYLDDFDREMCLMECKFDFSENYSKCWGIWLFEFPYWTIMMWTILFVFIYWQDFFTTYSIFTMTGNRCFLRS
jgi:hypothetical protein